MDRGKSSDLRNHEEDNTPSWADSDAAERHFTSYHKDAAYVRPGNDVSGQDESQEVRDRIRYHETQGSHRYKSYGNHSPADDQPTTDTGA